LAAFKTFERPVEMERHVLGISAAFTAVVFMGAFALFKSLDRYFADVI